MKKCSKYLFVALCVFLLVGCNDTEEEKLDTNLSSKIILNEENKEFDISIINETNSKDKFDEYMIVSENVRLPIELKKDERKNLRILVRNYFEENSNHQVVITKSRLVGFTKTEGGEIIA